jgi:uncharacterized membrane protein (UPF0127 family)
MGSFFARRIRHGRARIMINRRIFDAEVSDSGISKTFGLMFRNRIGSRKSMLFVFKNDAKHGFWMLNMRFCIDIIWIDKDMHVVDFVRCAKPCTSVLSCKAHIPKRPSRYVLEVACGTVESLGITKGQIIEVMPHHQ